MSANKVFGIDLGTTYSCISQVDRYGRPEVLSNMDGDPTTPSVVQFQGEDVIVGKLAKRSSRLDPDNVAQLVKRHIGEADWRFHAGGREWSAAGVSSLILGALAKDAERATGERVERRRHHRPGLLRQRGAQADEARGRAGRAQRARPDQRADRGGLRLRLRAGGRGERDRPRLRPRRRHVRHHDHRARGRRHPRRGHRRRPRARRRELGHRAGQPARRALPGAAPGRDRPVRRRLRRGRPADAGRGGQAVALPARARRRARHQRLRPRERLGHARGPRGGHAHAAGAHDRAHPPRADGGRLQGRHPDRPLPARRRLLEDAGRRAPPARRSSASTRSSPTPTSPWPRARRCTARRSSSSARSRRRPTAAWTSRRPSPTPPPSTA